MYIREALCIGCGACVETCPHGAISLVQGKAQIDSVLCADCRACADACPNNAIATALPILVLETRLARPQTPLPSAHPDLYPIPEKPVLDPRWRAIAPAAGAVLAFVGHEIAPRVATAVVRIMLKHVDEQTPPAPTLSAGKGRQRRLRRRSRGANS